MATGDMSATQIIKVWKSFHGVELTQLQEDKLEAAVLMIAEGSYKAGIVQGRAEQLKTELDNLVDGPDSTS